jgi:chemotaxis protein methyltransferase CheR
LPEGEIQEFVDAITTHTTSFFREKIQFDYLSEKLIPAWARRAADPRHRRVRLWSAGCSTGQEPYSLAASLRVGLPQPLHVDAKILGTDVSLGALREASRACYPLKTLAEIPERYRCFFKPSGAFASRHVAVPEELRSLVVLRPFNLMAEVYPFRGLFDAIFCRNVFIYFDAPTKHALAAKLCRFIAPRGHLFLGLSESLVRVPEGLRPIGHSIYERTV